MMKSYPPFASAYLYSYLHQNRLSKVETGSKSAHLSSIKKLTDVCKHSKLTDMKPLGEYIRELRDKNDLSLREFAAKLGGLSAAFLSDIELGRRYPSDDVLTDMARVLGTSIEDLKSHDTRAPIKELKQLADSNPAYGIALRKVIDSKISPEELINLADSKDGK